VISRRMFAKVKSTLNSSRISRSGRIAFGDTLYRLYSRSYKGHLKYTILVPFPHVPRVFIYGRQITLLGNKVTGVETKVFEARPRQSSRCSAFSKWNPSVCVAPTSLSLLLFSLLIPSPSIDFTEGSPEFSRGPSVVELHSRESSTDRTYSRRFASRCVIVGEDKTAPLGVRKKVAIGDAVLNAICFRDR